MSLSYAAIICNGMRGKGDKLIIMLIKKSISPNGSYLYKLVYSYAAIFFALFVIYAITCIVMMNEVKTGYEENSVQLMENVKDNIDHEVLRINQLANLIAANDEIIEELETEESSDFTYNDYRHMQYLKNIGITSDAVDEIYIYNKRRGRIVSSSTTAEMNEYFDVKHSVQGYTFEEWKSFLDNIDRKQIVILPSKVKNHDDNIEVNGSLAYIQPIPLNIEKDKALMLVILINIEKLTAGIGKIGLGTEGQFVILDKNGKPVISVGNMVDPSTLVSFDNSEYQIGKNKYSINVIESNVLSWKYIAIDSKQSHMDRMYFIIRMTALCMLAYIIVGMSLMYFFSRKNYKPLKGLVDKLKIAKERNTANDNEFNAIENAIETIQKEYRGLMRENQKGVVSSRERYLLSILEGKESNDKLFEPELMEKNDFVTISDSFCVMIIKIENPSSIIETMGMGLDMAQFALQNIISEMLGMQSAKCFTCSCSGDKLAVIVNFDNRVSDKRGLLEGVTNNFISFVADNFAMDLFVAVSDETEMIDGLSGCYREAMRALSYRNVKGKNMVVFYDDRTGGSAGELVKQDMLTIKNNKINLGNSEYVVTGIGKDTVNNINISFSDNELVSDKLKLYDESCNEISNIKISQ